MRFSIIIPTFNVREKLEITLNSIISQKNTDYEVIIQDGGSSDGIKEVVNKFLNEMPQLQFFEEEDCGVYDAMNKGVKSAIGEYCIFMGAGDSLFDENVLNDLSYELDHHEADIYYGYVMSIDGEKETPIIRKINMMYKVKFTPVCHQSVCAKRTLLLDYPFEIRYKIAADQDWLLKMLKYKKSFRFVNRAIANYPLDGLSSNNNELFEKEQREIHKRYYPFWQNVRHLWRVLTGKDNVQKKV